MTKDKIIKKIRNILIQYLQKELSSVADTAIAFSGSLDSGLVAFIVSKYCKTNIHLYTIGFPNCYDFKQSSKALKLLKIYSSKLIKHKQILLTDDILKKNLNEYTKLTRDQDKVSISYTVPFFILLKNIKEQTVVTGHGADTLFGGFYKYLESRNLKQDIRGNYRDFIDKLPKREVTIAKYFGKKLILPFADDKLAKIAQELPEGYLIRKNERKYILKKVAKYFGLPREIVDSPKKAIQYSTGTMRRLKSMLP